MTNKKKGDTVTAAEIAADLLIHPTAPFYEQCVIGHIETWASKTGLDSWRDKHGNLYVHYKKGKPGRKVTYAVHTDHPGFEFISQNGSDVVARFLGGVSQAYFRKGAPVVFYDRQGEERCRATIQSVRNWKKKWVNFKCATRLRKGYFGMWDLAPCTIRSGVLHSRACDDLLGCVALMATFERLIKLKPVADVVGVFSRAEEVGFIGALALVHSGELEKSRTIISIETSKALSDAVQGGGPIVRVGDRSSIFDPAITAEITATAENLVKENSQFKFQRRLMYGGTCESTAYQAYGYRVGAVCVALGNYHNMGPRNRIELENIHLSDLNGLITLLSEFAITKSAPKEELKIRLSDLLRKSRRRLQSP
ncbi:MAG: M20/M25/M40 family metallo-hydrolase [Verrucomicrobiota bacterium]|nr:M20/M25/M40 family metallo-hydrolase [Verrucomicrobiota bacterium]